MKHFCLLLILGALPAAGTTILFDNFGPGNTYSGPSGELVGDGAELNNAGRAWTVSFFAASTSPLESIVMGATHCGSGSFCEDREPPNRGTNAIIMSLYEDGVIGGSNLLESITVLGKMAPWTTRNDDIVTGVSVLHPLLVAGNHYWLVATVPNMLLDATIWGFSTNSSKQSSTFAKLGDGPWTFESSSELAFRINGTVPEPGTVSLLGAGIIVLAVLRKRMSSSI